jgi:NADH-quinone oxidoreductase subunit G
MSKLQIDGKEVEVEDGLTILEAAERGGLEIPHLCYHPGLSIAGNCRVCLVEVEKAPKLVISCKTPVAEGMVVHTHSETVIEARKAVMEFMLINHPLDCPICDQAGECMLQDNAVAHGTGETRFTEQKELQNKAVDIGRHILLDQERCIYCSRCIRFCDEVTATSELSFFNRGNQSRISIAPGKPLDNNYSGNVVDICPVGALTLKESRFQTRVWFLKHVPTICAGCSRGCNVVVGVGKKQTMMTFAGQIDDRIKRIVPRFNEEVNGHWCCDEGRLSYMPLEAAPRLLSAQAPSGTDLEWDTAIEITAAKLILAAGIGRAAAILSPRLGSEAYFAWKGLFDALGGFKIGVTDLVRGEDDELLSRADKGANTTGAGWILGGHSDAQAILDAVGRGEIDSLLIVGDSLDPQDTTSLDETLRAKLTELIYVGPFLDAAARQATVLLPCAAWAEEDGTFVNFEGRIQQVQRVHLPRGEGRPSWKVAAEIGRAAGLEARDWQTAAEVLADLATKVNEYNGITIETLGLLGRNPSSSGA